MRKFVFWLALIVSISIIGTFTLASSEKVTINFLISEPQEVETFEKIISEFEKQNPNIKVDMDSTAYADYYTVLKTRLLGGETDVFMTSPGGIMTDIVKGEFAVELTDQPFLENFYKDKAVEESVTFNGKVFGIVKTNYIYLIIYNKDMFDEYGVDYPKDIMVSFEELKEISDIFNQKGLPAVAFGLAEAWSSGSIGQTLISQITYPENVWVEIVNGEEKFTDKLFRKVAEALDEYSNSGIIDPNAAGTTYDGSISLFASRQVPMVAAGSWALGSYAEQGIRQGVIIPVAPSVKNPSYQSMPANIFCANAKSDKSKLDASLTFLEFLSTAEAGKIYQDGTKQVSRIKGVVVDDPVLQLHVDIFQSGYPTTLGLSGTVDDLEMRGVLESVTALLLRPGDKDVDAIIEQSQSDLDSIFARK